MPYDSADDEPPPPKTKKKTRGPRNEGLDISNVLPRTTRHQDDRRPTKKADATSILSAGTSAVLTIFPDKENGDSVALKIAQLEKSLKNARNKAKQAQKNAPGISLLRRL
jgi:hypothetical protein